MKRNSVRPADSEIERIVNTYADSLYRMCMVSLCNRFDAEDAVSETIMRFIKYSPVFRDKEHEKAWLIRVAVNICADIGRRRSKCIVAQPDILIDTLTKEENLELKHILESLDKKYREVIVLHYIEGYSSKEIAHIFKTSDAAIRKRLQYAREKLKQLLM